jgi:hypothetical protein
MDFSVICRRWKTRNFISNDFIVISLKKSEIAQPAYDLLMKTTQSSSSRIKDAMIYEIFHVSVICVESKATMRDGRSSLVTQRRTIQWT